MKYYKNKYLEVSFKSKDKVITIEAKDIHIDGYKDKEYTTFIFKPNKFIMFGENVTIVKISNNRWYNFFYFEKSNYTIHVHDIEDIIISKSGIIIE